MKKCYNLIINIRVESLRYVSKSNLQSKDLLGQFGMLTEIDLFSYKMFLPTMYFQ